MNFTNHRLNNINPSIFNHEYCIGADADSMSFSSLNRIDQPFDPREPAEIADFIGNSSVSLHPSIEDTSIKFAPPKGTKLGQKADNFGADSNAKKVNCDVSSVVSFGSDSNALSPLSSKAVDDDKLLHRACQLFPASPEIIYSALLADEGAIRRHERLTLTAKSSASKAAVRRRCPLSEPYRLPLNIALKHKASLEVLKILVDAGPDTLELRDGYEQSTPLNIALKTKPRDVSTIDLLLLSNAKCAMISDRRHNYPLHMACLRGSCLEVVRRLYSVYPDALLMKNFSGETPLDIAQRCSMCPEDVLNFLQQIVACGSQYGAHCT